MNKMFIIKKSDGNDIIKNKEIIRSYNKSKNSGKYELVYHGFCITYFIKYIDKYTVDFVIQDNITYVNWDVGFDYDDLNDGHCPIYEFKNIVINPLNKEIHFNIQK